MIGDHLYARFSIALGGLGLRTVGRLNVPIYRLTKGRLMGAVGRAPVLLLTTTGRRSGASRTAPVLYMREGERLVVIGSNAGNEKAPAWALNLQATQEAEVEIRGERKQVLARVAVDPEREQLWRMMNEQYAGFDDYKANTSRNILVFVLEPR